MQLQKEELAAIALLLCASVAICAFSFMSFNGSAPYTNDSRIGDTVRLEGTVLHKDSTGTGGHVLLTIKTDGSPVTVFVASSSSAFAAANRASPGNLVAIQGKLQDYKGSKEILASIIEIK